MTIKLCHPKKAARRKFGLSLIEVVVSIGLFSITAVAVMAGIPSIIYKVHYGQRQTEATRIMLEKMEALRMEPWEVLTNRGLEYFETSAEGSDSMYDYAASPAAAGTGPSSQPTGGTLLSGLTGPGQTTGQTDKGGGGVLQNPHVSEFVSYVGESGTGSSPAPSGTSSSSTSTNDAPTNPGPGGGTFQSHVYRGTVTVDATPIQPSYGTTLAKVTIRMEWQDLGRTNATELTAFVSQYGVQTAENH